jgi:hypothetical protein
MKKSIRRIETPISFYYPTSDDWCPNFPRDTVEFRVHVFYNCYMSTKPHDGMIRICVGGQDDFGMERDERLNMSEYETRLEEIRYWLEHKLPNPVTQNWLRTQGFRIW